MNRLRFAALFLAATGCSLITKLDGLGADASAPSDATTEKPVCGVVGVACCAPNTCAGGATCTQGSCMCAAPTVACGATCADLQKDAKNCGSCGRSCLGGACQGGVCQASVLLTGQNGARGLALAPTKLLWARVNIGSISGGLFAADLDGQNVATLYDANAAPCTIVTATATDAYFYCSPNLQRCSLPACSDATVLATTIGVADLAFDAPSARLYFTVRTPYGTQTGGFVGSVPAAGGAITRLVAADQLNPTTLQIEGGTVYWLNGGTYTNDTHQKNGGVRKAPTGTNQTESVVASDPSGGDYLGLWIDGSKLYYGAGSAAEVHTTLTVGGAASKFAASVTAPSAVVGDSSFVYWTSGSAAGGLTRCERTCVAPTQLAGGANATLLVQDATSLYWIDAGTGEIRRLAK